MRERGGHSRLHDTAGDDLGLLEHPSPHAGPGDVVVLPGDREASSLDGWRLAASGRSSSGDSADGSAQIGIEPCARSRAKRASRSQSSLAIGGTHATPLSRHARVIASPQSDGSQEPIRSGSREPGVWR